MTIASSIPRTTRSACRSSSVRASGLSGSASYAFATTYASRPTEFARTARSFSASEKPAPPRPRSPDAATRSIAASTSSAGSSTGTRAPSSKRAAVLAGIRGLDDVVHLVLVQLVVRGRWRLRRPCARDREISGEAPTAARHRGALAFGRATEVRKQRGRGVHVGHRLPELDRDELRGAPRQVAVRGVRLVQDTRHAVRALFLTLEDAADLPEVELRLVLRGDRRHGGGQRTAVAVRRRRDHADAVVVRAWREERPAAEGVAERIRDRDGARWAGLLAHEAALALEDARFGLEQQRDEAAAALGEDPLLVWVLPRDRTWSDEMLQGSEHSG